jgi:3-deoxy-D-manno-oct-2-ulosonic acid (Kdo) hydroxylase
LAFDLADDERAFLDPALAGDARKNISLDPADGRLGNSVGDDATSRRLARMMERFAESSEALLRDLLPRYAPQLEVARTSFRPAEIEGRAYSARHDDKRLHIDAFASRPLGGKRILRIFTNIATDGSPRRWQVGENFADFARTFVPRVKPPAPGSAWLYQRLGFTKGRRTEYDHRMLGLHDRAKLDATYQRAAPRADIAFPPGTSWACFTDQVMHAALSGHGALEQTFYLPISALSEPATSPLRVLERLAGRTLV